MTRMLMGSVIAVVCSVGLAAQTPTGTTKPQSPTTQGQTTQKPATQADDKSATFRGCLRAGDEAGQYVLADATATSGATLKNARVQLVGSPAGMNLKEHVGHTVEVTGMLVAGDKAAGAGATGGGAAGKPTAANPGSAAGGKSGAGAGAGAGSARLNVKSVKHVKETC